MLLRTLLAAARRQLQRLAVPRPELRPWPYHDAPWPLDHDLGEARRDELPVVPRASARDAPELARGRGPGARGVSKLARPRA